MLPDDGSRIVSPGCRAPSFSASSTIFERDAVLRRAAGVLALELGVDPDVGFGDSACTPTSGVSPIRSRIALVAGHGARPDRVSRRRRRAGSRATSPSVDRGVELLEVPDVVVVHVHVDELVQRRRTRRPAGRPGPGSAPRARRRPRPTVAPSAVTEDAPSACGRRSVGSFTSTGTEPAFPRVHRTFQPITRAVRRPVVGITTPGSRRRDRGDRAVSRVQARPSGSEFPRGPASAASSTTATSATTPSRIRYARSIGAAPGARLTIT